MSVEFTAPSRAPRRARRSTGDRLREAVLALAQGHGELRSHGETSWASITFTGTRHRLVLAFDGMAAVEAGEALVAQLPEHEFTLPGQLVADAGVVAVDSTLLPEPHMLVTAELLLLEDC